MIFQALSVSRIYKVFFPGASSLTRGFALSLGCGEHCWLEHIRGRKILIPRDALRYPLLRDNPLEDFYRPCRHTRIVFINPGSRRDRTLLPVKGGLRPLSHTPEINNAEFYDNGKRLTCSHRGWKTLLVLSVRAICRNGSSSLPHQFARYTRLHGCGER